MSQYPKYTPPSVAGVTFAMGSGSQQPAYPGLLCSKADAEIIVNYLGGTLVNLAEPNSLGYTFEGVDPNGAQPWAVAGIEFPGPVGQAVAIMWGPNPVNGGGVGNPGTWAGLGTGNVSWVPQAPPPPPAVDHSFNPSDPNWFAIMQGSQQAFGQTDRNNLNDLRRLVVALAAKQGIS